VGVELVLSFVEVPRNGVWRDAQVAGNFFGAHTASGEHDDLATAWRQECCVRQLYEHAWVGWFKFAAHDVVSLINVVGKIYDSVYI
jgi:hypothetical protein